MHIVGMMLVHVLMSMFNAFRQELKQVLKYKTSQQPISYTGIGFAKNLRQQKQYRDTKEIGTRKGKEQLLL